MSKQEFMSELRQRLGKMDEATRNEVCAEMEDRFAEGLSMGYTEDEICRDFGGPAAIAEQLTNTPSSPQDEAGYAANRPGFDGKSSYEINIDQSFTGVSGIDIRLSANNLSIRSSNAEDDTVRVIVNGTAKNKLFKIEQSGGHLVVYENTPRFSFEAFLFSVKIDTVVYIPVGFNGNIRAKNAKGKMEVFGINGGALDLHSSAGNVSAEYCTFNSISARASAGNARAVKLNANFIKFHSAAGNVETEDTLGELDAHSGAGNVRVTRHEGNIMKVNSSAGKVVITDCSAGIDAHSSAGNVEINCERTVIGGVKASSPAGSVKLSAAEAGNLKLDSAAGAVKARIGRLNGNADISASAGSIKLELHEIFGDVRAVSSMGSVKLKLPYQCNCRIETTAKAGSVRNHVKQNETGEYVIRAESNMGSVKIDAI